MQGSWNWLQCGAHDHHLDKSIPGTRRRNLTTVERALRASAARDATLTRPRSDRFLLAGRRADARLGDANLGLLGDFRHSRSPALHLLSLQDGGFGHVREFWHGAHYPESRQKAR